MTVSFHDLLGVSVVTVSGQTIGTVTDFAFDAMNGQITTLFARPSRLLARFSGSVLPISWDAVVECTVKRILVQDAVLSVEEGAPLSAFPAPHPTG